MVQRKSLIIRAFKIIQNRTFRGIDHSFQEEEFSGLQVLDKEKRGGRDGG